MSELTFLRDLAVVMAISAATTVLFHLLRQPVVLGYIVAGVIIGPHTPPFPYVTDLHSIHTLAELGVLLLLFSLGLEFDLRKLRQVGAVAFLAAILEVLLMIWLGYSVGRFLGWREMDSLFLGAILSISSTTITSTGASIIAIYRDPDQILVPQPETVILPGDVLWLLGEKEELTQALRYLAELSKQKAVPPGPPPEAATAPVGERSPIAGRTVAETGFRKSWEF
ncbi:MAG TPA: cation:proton antiporter [Candidatus Acidoferrales bacterium]|nr:cation:proton antiporter [Candidatus Acidoferrales bacterium]